MQNFKREEGCDKMLKRHCLIYVECLQTYLDGGETLVHLVGFRFLDKEIKKKKKNAGGCLLQAEVKGGEGRIYCHIQVDI